MAIYNSPRDTTEHAGKNNLGERKTPAPIKPYMKGHIHNYKRDADFAGSDRTLQKEIQAHSKTVWTSQKSKPKNVLVKFEYETKHTTGKTPIQLLHHKNVVTHNDPQPILTWIAPKKVLKVGSHVKSFAALKNAVLEKTKEV